ncbi:MAG: HEAT repeat domain-containing protein [Gemmataceae bacterium]|nr:HEAT repeat domain-containing protein [Gemmataceae bacterium]
MSESTQCAKCQKPFTPVAAGPDLCPECAATPVAPPAMGKLEIPKPKKPSVQQPAKTPAAAVQVQSDEARDQFLVHGLLWFLLLLVGVPFVVGIISMTKPQRPSDGALAALDNTPFKPDIRVPPTPSIPPPALAPMPAIVAQALPAESSEEPELLPFPMEERGAPEKKAVAFKRRNLLDDEKLRQQLMAAPELALDGPSTGQILKVGLTNPNVHVDFTPQLMQKRPEFKGLAVLRGAYCQLGQDPALDLQVLSRVLRKNLEAAIPKAGTAGLPADSRPSADLLRQQLQNDKKQWQRPEAIPTLLQLLMSETKEVRMLLVELLAEIKGAQASQALAQRALFDLNFEIREKAVEALKSRPLEEYQDVLLEGFQYPWPAVADFAAEALAALGARELAPRLVLLLSAKDATLPFITEVNKQKTPVLREMVRINHLANCLLCHAPSFQNADLVRGRVPLRGQPLPAPVSSTAYYEGSQGIFVQASVTYLRQDFSVSQPMDAPGPWPKYQRYDYLVRFRPLNAKEQADWRKWKDKTVVSHRNEAILFALGELSRTNFGPRPEDWILVHDPLTGELLDKNGNPEDLIHRALITANPKRQLELLGALRILEGSAYDKALLKAMPSFGKAVIGKARETLGERFALMPFDEHLDRLSDLNKDIRLAAVAGLGVRNCTHLIPELKRLLADADPDVAQEAAQALCLVDSQFTPASEVKRLADDLIAAKPQEQKEKLEVFRGIESKVYELALAKALPELSDPMQLEGWNVLSDRYVSMPVDELRERCRDKNVHVRMAAVLAARKKLNRSLVPDLVDLLSDANPRLRLNVRITLQDITGQNFGPSVDNDTHEERTRALAAWHSWIKKQGL